MKERRSRKWKITLLAAGIGLFASAGARAQTVGGPEHVQVSITAGETYIIDNLKPGSSPAFRVIQNPQALITNRPQPATLVLLGAAAGQWEVDVTDNAGRDFAYDVNVRALAQPGAPLTPGISPPALSDTGLGERAGAGADSAGIATGPETVRVPAPPSGMTVAPLPGAATVNSPPSRWNETPMGTGEIPHASTQTTGTLETRTGQFRNDPSVLESGAGYSSAAVSGANSYLPAEAVTLMTGTSRVIDFRSRLTRISVADSKIADVQIINPFEFNLIGHQPGFTTLALWDAQGNHEERQVRIDASGRQQVMLNTIVAELDRTGIENQGINLTVALQREGISLVSLPGLVATPFSGQSSGSSGSSITTLPPGGDLIPMLLSQNITDGLAAQGAGVVTQTLFQFLEQHSLGRILAQPHLMANSGEKAKFLSGGEIPIVIAQALNSSIVFKQFGTSVEFIPTVVGRDDIELLVKPEVSQPDFAHGVQLFGFTVPAFVTRRAETLVRLKDQQTLIIAGLILHEKISTVQKVPYLGDIPYAGAMFRNTQWSDKETDLVMSVTPEIVSPLPAGAQVYLPSNRGSFSRSEIETRAIVPPDPARPRF